MTGEEIKNQLMEVHKEFKDFVVGMDSDSFLRAPEGKWNAGQHLSHVVKSLKGIHTGLVLPKFQLKVMFGTANRPSRTYEEVVTKYREKLAAGYENKSAYMPTDVSHKEANASCDKMMSYASRIGKRLEGHHEDDLDKYLMPHPLIGKMTLREFGYFTIYHCGHHLELIKKYSAEKS